MSPSPGLLAWVQSTFNVLGSNVQSALNVLDPIGLLPVSIHIDSTPISRLQPTNLEMPGIVSIGNEN